MIEGLGERLRIVLKENNMSLNACAKATGVAHSTISNYICKSCDPTATKLAKIAKHIGVSTDWLMGLSTEMYTSKAKPEKQAVPNQPKTRIVKRTVVVAPNMQKSDWVLAISDYTGLSPEAIIALHNSRKIKIKWIESEEKQ